MRYVTIKYYTDDVLAVRPDLTDEQALHVLTYLAENHDVSVGMSLDVIEDAAEHLYRE